MIKAAILLLLFLLSCMNCNADILNNGVSLSVYDRNTVNLIGLTANIDAGHADGDCNKGQTAHFLEHVIAHKIKQLSPIHGVDPYFDASTMPMLTRYSLKLPSKHQSSFVSIVNAIIETPTIPADEFERHRQVIIRETAGNGEAPVFSHAGVGVSRQFMAGTNCDLNKTGINDISISDVLDFHSRYYQDPVRIRIGLIGPVMNSLKSALKEILLSLTESEPGTARKIVSFNGIRHLNLKVSSVALTIYQPKTEVSIGLKYLYQASQLNLFFKFLRSSGLSYGSENFTYRNNSESLAIFNSLIPSDSVQSTTNAIAGALEQPLGSKDFDTLKQSESMLFEMSEAGVISQLNLLEKMGGAHLDMAKSINDVTYGEYKEYYLQQKNNVAIVDSIAPTLITRNHILVIICLLAIILLSVRDKLVKKTRPRISEA